ncbi:hypothetical protein WJX81_000675 [Elliptochloris bilobata]|uniref:DNA-(apurinic or apyrimidinic site) endonuclease n=1 Tax=Elliptochloris bilobata TaxID=381761 RepID=A0AAW1R1B6_9CHLO
MRIITWNINGLRAIIKHRGFGTLSNLLDFLHADIIAFQETKVARSELEREFALAEGWESFFAFCRTRTGYSGVATYCRQGVAEPLAAEEGFTGTLSKGAPGALPDSAAGSLGSCYGDLPDRFSLAELEALDSEGRCVVTDHGAFVLFNVYGPAITNADTADERFAFKLRFFEALEYRMQALRAAGRRVILLGDLNIAPSPLDHCDPGPVAEFTGRADRAWLRRLLDSSFRDVFRMFYPDRRLAYSCWSTASGARVNNYGSRIDLILAADADVPPSGVWADARGSDHAPVWADVALPAPLPRPPAPPPLSTRFLFTGTQGTLRSWLAAGAAAGKAKGCVAAAAGGGTNPSLRGAMGRAEAAAAWRSIQQRMKPPTCAGHGEPCVIRQVKKAGANKDRLFYVCNRADGLPPEGRCDFFVWADSRTPRSEQGAATKRQRK